MFLLFCPPKRPFSPPVRQRSGGEALPAEGVQPQRERGPQRPPQTRSHSVREGQPIWRAAQRRRRGFVQAPRDQEDLRTAHPAGQEVTSFVRHAPLAPTQGLPRCLLQEKQAATNRILLKKERASGFQDGRLDVVARFNGSTEALDRLDEAPGGPCLPATLCAAADPGGPAEAVSPTVSQLSAVFEKSKPQSSVYPPQRRAAPTLPPKPKPPARGGESGRKVSCINGRYQHHRPKQSADDFILLCLHRVGNGTTGWGRPAAGHEPPGSAAPWIRWFFPNARGRQRRKGQFGAVCGTALHLRSALHVLAQAGARRGGPANGFQCRTGTDWRRGRLPSVWCPSSAGAGRSPRLSGKWPKRAFKLFTFIRRERSRLW